MKQMKFFLLLFATIAFAACSNDDNTTPEIDGGAVNARDAWMSFRIQQSSGGTRALNYWPERENGTVNETKISNVKAIFFRYTGGMYPIPFAQEHPNDFMVVDMVDLEPSQIGTPGQNSAGVAGKAFQVSRFVQYVLLVANHTTNNLPTITKGTVAVDGGGNFLSITGGFTFAQVNAAITDATEANVITDGFMMTNAKGDLEPSVWLDDPTLTELKTYSTQIEAEAAGNSVKITLDRVSAKVRVYNDIISESLPTRIDGMPVYTNASVYNFGWVLNVTNTSFYPMSQRTQTFREIDDQHQSIWSDPYALGSYRVDPNYGPIENTPGNAQTIYKTYIPGIKEPETWNLAGTAEYCLENTQDEASNMKGYTTQVLLKVNYAPRGLPKANGSQINVDEGQDWLTLGGVMYTYETLMEWIREELNHKYATKPNPDDVGADRAAELNKYLVQINLTPVPILTVAELEAKYTTDGFSPTNIATEIDEIIGAFEALKSSIEAGTLTVGNLTYYKGGICYYTILIKHDNDSIKGNNKLGEYGVVRNSVYDIRINSINHPGEPIIPIPKPEDPNEEDNNYISFDIQINPWTWYSQSVDL